MNVVLDSAAEVNIKGDSKRRELGTSSSLAIRTRERAGLADEISILAFIIGRILLKGDNITLIQPLV
jgi:small nuclear ribonucleoprotein (snRNP)-like protein